MTKQPKTKKAGSSRKAPKKAAAKTARTKPTKAPTKRKRDPRVPAPGTVLTREYKGKTIRVTVLEEGFRWERKEYRSLSALAAAITGAKSINGFLWFRLTGRKPKIADSSPLPDDAS